MIAISFLFVCVPCDCFKSRALTRGSIGTIPEPAETENTRSYQGGLWLPFLDSYRTMCLAPNPHFLRILVVASADRQAPNRSRARPRGN